VNEGAVVVAPFSEECVAQGFGPCSTNAVELTADSLQLIEFDSNMTLPRLVPLVVSEESAEQLQGAAPDTGAQQSIVEASAEEEDKKATSKEVVLESVTSVGVADEVVSDIKNAGGEVVASYATVTDWDAAIETLSPAYQTGFTPFAQIDVNEAKQRQLV